jgi:serine/threonine-protein kinase
LHEHKNLSNFPGEAAPVGIIIASIHLGMDASAIRRWQIMSDLVILNDRYQLEEPLGKGGMAVVYRARDLMLERIVAVKILRRRLASDPDFRERFRQEAKAAANLSHPNIVTVHDFVLDTDQLYIVMEYVPGKDLKTLQRDLGRFSIKQAIDLIVQACNGIGYAHRAGLVHCDVKPQNMLIMPDWRLKVVDFGIARAQATISPDERVDVVWGSPLYFSPEQAAGLAPSPASDVYSLGVMLYEMLTGQLPFSAHSPEELSRLHREAPPLPPRRLNPNIPPSLEQIMLKVLSKEPAARYRTADQLGRVLLNFNQQPLHKPAAVPAPRTSGPISPPQPLPPPNVIDPAAAIITYPTSSKRSTTGFDWLTWLLALLALIAAGGLVPFWLWVYYVLNPPV